MLAHLAWTQPSGGAVVDYEVRRTTDGGTPEILATLPGNATSYDNDPIEVDHMYSFTVIARNTFGEAQSNTETLDTRQPAAPVLTVGIP